VKSKYGQIVQKAHQARRLTNLTDALMKIEPLPDYQISYGIFGCSPKSRQSTSLRRFANFGEFRNKHLCDVCEEASVAGPARHVTCAGAREQAYGARRAGSSTCGAPPNRLVYVELAVQYLEQGFRMPICT